MNVNKQHLPKNGSTHATLPGAIVKLHVEEGVPGFEPYLNIPNINVKKSVANQYAWLKSCKICCDEDVIGIQQLPFAAYPIIEDVQTTTT